MRHTFFGGVSPAPHKELTRRKPIAPLSCAPEHVYIPLQTCEGRPAVPLVHPGDRVQVGQPIGRADGSGVPIHASVSGQVVAIADHPHPWGGSAPAITIQNDGQDTLWTEGFQPVDLDQITLGLLLERVQAAGICGMGGSCLPTAEKLQQAAGKADTLIINAAECEPYVSADHRLLLEHMDQLLQCARTIGDCLDVKHIALVTEGDKLNAAEIAERWVQRHRGRTRLYTIRTRYPLGAEKQIVQTVTGQELPRGYTPLDGGCVILNLSTVYAIRQALFEGRALTHRAVTVSGGAVVRPRNLWVPIGTPLCHLLAEAEGLRDGCAQLLTCGVMRGRSVEELSAPVIKDTSSLIALSAWEMREDGPETTCIRCGKCAAACPMHLVPSFILQAMHQKETARLQRLHPEDCISCGCCSYVCPANIPLMALVNSAGQQLETGGDL